MLLEEIIPLQNKTIRTKSPLDIHKFHRNNVDNKIGSGFFSTVYNDKDEHMVKKISNNSDMKDSYWDYADALIQSGIWESNPHFPRIYSIKKFTHGSETHYKGTMERLLGFGDCSNTELYTCYSNLLDVGKVADHYKAMDTRDPSYKDTNILRFISMVTTALDNAVENDNYDIVTDATLKEALQWIRQILDSFAAKGKIFGGVDIHKNNIMYRRTKYGIQLVLSDPVA